MKKIFKNLLIPATGLVILPIVGCSTVQQPEEKETTLEIVSDIKDINVAQEEGHLSEPIKTKCIGPDQKERQINVQFELKMIGNDNLPNWICITDKNEIQIIGGKEIGTYTFTLSAFNENEKLYSNVKTFKVNVVDERHIVPESLEINITNDQYYAYAEQSTIPFTITPSKEGVEEKYLLNQCNCSVSIISGKKDKDLLENPLFVCNDDVQNHYLTISKETDQNYVDDYVLKISATLVEDPTIKAEKYILLHIDNLLEQYDPINHAHLYRTKSDNGWTVRIVDGAPSILDIKDVVIHHMHIIAIGANMCSNSRITYLSQVILPDSVFCIEDNAFANQSALCSVQMPCVTWVGTEAFLNDSQMTLRAKSTPPKFKSVGRSAFSGCTLVDFGEQTDLTWVGDYAFNNAGFSRFVVGEKCTRLSTDTFVGCKNLEYFEVKAKSPPKISGSIFSGCDKLKKIYVPAESYTLYKGSNWDNQNVEIEGIL